MTANPSIERQPPPPVFISYTNRMKPKHALYGFFAVMAAYGALAGYYQSFGANPPRSLEFALTALTIVLLYVWYYLDAEERQYNRTALLGGAVILLSALAIPYYLVRSRPPGARVKALGKFLGLAVLSVVVTALAAVPFGLFANGG